MVSLRPYQLHYNVIISLLANVGIVHYYMTAGNTVKG